MLTIPTDGCNNVRDVDFLFFQMSYDVREIQVKYFDLGAEREAELELRLIFDYGELPPKVNLIRIPNKANPVGKPMVAVATVYANARYKRGMHAASEGSSRSTTCGFLNIQLPASDLFSWRNRLQELMPGEHTVLFPRNFLSR